MRVVRSVRGRKLQAGVVVGTLAGLLAASGAYFRPSILERGEFWTYDSRARRAAHAERADPNIVLIDVAEEDIRDVERHIKVPFPWPRSMYAYIARHVAAGQPRAIIFDWLFQGRGVGGTDDAAEFAAAMEENGRTVIGIYVSNREPDPPRPAVGATLRRFDTPEAAFEAGLKLLAYDARVFARGNEVLIGGDDETEFAELWSNLAATDELKALFPRSRPAATPLFEGELTDAALARRLPAIETTLAFPQRRTIDLPLPQLAVAAARLGDVVQSPEADGILRRYNLVTAHDGRVYPSLALAGFLVANPAATPPLDSFAIRFHGGDRSYKHHSAYQVLRSFQQVAEKQAPQVPSSAFKDKYVIVSATAHALADMRATPVDKTHLGAAITAAALDNLLHGDAVIRVAPAVDAALAFGLAILLAVGMVLIGSSIPHTVAALLATSVATAAALGGYLVAAAYLFDARGLWIAAATPVAGAVLATFSALLVASAMERNDKRFVEKALNRYTSKALTAQLMKHPEYLALGGARREISVYFSDIAGFTTISEGLSPERLVELLNEYLTAMTDIVDKYGGYVDKYIGDAVMAFWGGLVPDNEHARKAVLAAVEMRNECARRAPDWRQRFGADIMARAGVNSGQSVVGNMGSQNKFNYTAMGDMVNIASRLEGANKPYGTVIMISESTYTQVQDLVDCRELDFMTVKGKNKPITVYEVLEQKGKTDPVTLRAVTRFGEGLVLYRTRRFSEARAVFADAVSIRPDDEPSKMYMARCEHFMNEPPAEDWDGVWHMKEK